MTLAELADAYGMCIEPGIIEQPVIHVIHGGVLYRLDTVTGKVEISLEEV